MNLPDGKPILESHPWCPGCDESGVENASHYACKACLEEIERLKEALEKTIFIYEHHGTQYEIYLIAKQALGEE